MSIHKVWLALASIAVVSVGTAQAQINGIKDHLRLFNDFPGTVLVHSHGNSVNQGPGISQETVLESGWVDDMAGGNFANRHDFTFSSDGGLTDHIFGVDDSYTVKMLVTLEDTYDNPTKEAGFFLRPTVCCDMQFIVKSQDGDSGGGEIAAFGGGGPFKRFSEGAAPDYTTGDTILIGFTMLGNGAAPNTTNYFIDRDPFAPGGEDSTGFLPWTNLEGGPVSNYTLSMYTQSAPNLAPLPPEVVSTIFNDIMFMPIPEPTTMMMAIMAMLGLVGVRRRAR